MINTQDFKKGIRIELDASPWTIVHISTQSPSARGASTLVKVRLKNVLNGLVSDRTFKSGDRVATPDLEMKTVIFLYSTPDGNDAMYHFMDNTNYEQFELWGEQISDVKAWLTEDLEVKAVFYNGKVVGIELPQFVELLIDMVEPGTRGDTASGSVTTTAYTDSGIKVQVPLFIKSGDRVRVDTTTGQFKDRCQS